MNQFNFTQLNPFQTRNSGSVIKRIWLLLLLVALPQFGLSQEEKAEMELLELLEDFLEGAGKNDAKMHDRFWAEDLIYTSSSGERFGKKQLMEGVKNADEDFENSMVWTAEDVQIRVYGEMAVITFRLLGIPRDGLQQQQFLNSGTFVNKDGKWKAVNWQATRASSE
ncbi:nuclear transport factor 2 family protein [Gramella sp. BOM4]|nr:nuclear transport factor 2 family protein [Christiangramia bathymodioli]